MNNQARRHAPLAPAFLCRPQDKGSQCPYLVRRLPAALGFANNSDYLIESRASRGAMAFSTGGNIDNLAAAINDSDRNGTKLSMFSAD